jgi:hypothetical protein
VRTFNIVLKTAGTQSLTVTDLANPPLTSSRSGMSVSAAAAASFAVSGYATTTTAGVSHTFTLTARDAFGNVATGYAGTVHFSSSDSQAGLPANYNFAPGDAGTHTFSAMLKTAGVQALSAIDANMPTILGSQGGINVAAATATHFSISAPADVTSQISFNITVTALDAYGNIATGYLGKIHFTSSDKHPTFPSDYTYTSGDAGMHTFTVALRSLGSMSIAVKDTANNSITGTTQVNVLHA